MASSSSVALLSDGFCTDMPKTRVWVSANGIPHTIDDRNRCLTFGHGCPCVDELEASDETSEERS
jgi:hypothetical protein